MPPEAIQQLARQVLTADPRLRKAALEALDERGDPDVVPSKRLL
jgi:HEAT repeat protein